MEEKQTTSPLQNKKQKTEVPKTEISQTQDKAARNYYILMGCIIAGAVVVGGYLIYRLASQYAQQANINKAQDIEISDLEIKQKNLVALQPNYDKIIAPGANGVSQKKLIL